MKRPSGKPESGYSVRFVGRKRSVRLGLGKVCNEDLPFLLLRLYETHKGLHAARVLLTQELIALFASGSDNREVRYQFLSCACYAAHTESHCLWAYSIEPTVPLVF